MDLTERRRNRCPRMRYVPRIMGMFKSRRHRADGQPEQLIEDQGNAVDAGDGKFCRRGEIIYAGGDQAAAGQVCGQIPDQFGSKVFFHAGRYLLWKYYSMPLFAGIIQKSDLKDTGKVGIIRCGCQVSADAAGAWRNINVERGSKTIWNSRRKPLMQRTWMVWLCALICTALWGSAFPCIKTGYVLFDIVLRMWRGRSCLPECVFLAPGFWRF